MPKRKLLLSPYWKLLVSGPMYMQGEDVGWYLKVRENIVVIRNICLFEVFQESVGGFLPSEV